MLTAPSAVVEAEPSSPEELSRQALSQAKAAVQEGRFTEALDHLDAMLAWTPESCDGLYLQAVCRRYLKQGAEAAASLDRLQALFPDYGRGYQERGHLLRDSGQAEKALAAYQQATAVNPALLAGWQAQAEINTAMNRPEAARWAQQQADFLAALPPEVLGAKDLMHEGALLKADKLCRAFLKRNPTHVEAMRVLADLAVQFGVLEDAETVLQGVVALAPQHRQARLDYIQVLSKRQKYSKSLAEAEALYRQEPANPVIMSRYAIEALQTGDFDTAMQLFDNVLARLPEDPATLTSRGHALKTHGRQEAAIDSYRRAYRARPDHGDAYYGLANLKTYRFSDDEIEAMRAAEDKPTTLPANRVFLCFALGKALEDRGDITAAFDYYSRGNALKRRQSRYDADRMSAELAAQRSFFTKEFFAGRTPSGHPAADPIFIVGLPRAGSTLIEQILASHSQVDGTLELPNILSLAQRLRGQQGGAGAGGYLETLGALDSASLAAMGAEYIEETRIHRQSAPFFTDKMPNNFRHIGLIHLILPNARIIDARREPLACCWSGFKQLFAEGQEFSYDLGDIGRYYRDYVELMRHWHDVLPGRVLTVHHEDVLDDLEAQVRRILSFCGLPFEAACVDFHKTERSVRTASSEQVRRPINRDGVDQWRAFDRYLGPLRDALGPAREGYRQ